MKKKFGAVIMAGAMACSMTAGLAFTTGCGAIPDFVMPAGGYDGSEVEIMFYNTMGQNLRGVLDGAITRFNQRYPKITVKYDATSGDYDTLRDKIAVEITGRKQPNLAYCYPDHVALYNQSRSVVALDGFLPGGEYESKNLTVTREDTGAVEPLTLTQAQKDDFIEAYYEEGSVFGDDKMYTLPFAKSTEVLYYNVDFFKKNDLTPPTSGMTWDEIFDLCAKIKEKDPNCTPLGIDSESNLFITLCEQYGSPYTSAEDNNHYLFNNDINKGFVTKFKEWYSKGYFTTQTINKSYTSNLFKEQKSYMSIGSSAGASYQVPEWTGKADFEVNIVSIPQVNPEKPKTISQGPSVCIFKSKDAQEVIASWMFLKFLTTDIAFQATFSETSGYVPVLKSVFENETYKESLKNANGYATGITFLSAKVCEKLVQDKAYYTSPAFVGSSKARDEVGILMVAVLTGAKTLDEAFKDAIDECNYFAG